MLMIYFEIEIAPNVLIGYCFLEALRHDNFNFISSIYSNWLYFLNSLFCVFSYSLPEKLALVSWTFKIAFGALKGGEKLEASIFTAITKVENKRKLYDCYFSLSWHESYLKFEPFWAVWF